MMKKDISANLYQKCFILCSKILLNVLYNLGVTILFPWQHTGFQTSPILKVFLATLCVQFLYLQISPDIQKKNERHFDFHGVISCRTRLSGEPGIEHVTCRLLVRILTRGKSESVCSRLRVELGTC